MTSSRTRSPTIIVGKMADRSGFQGHGDRTRLRLTVRRLRRPDQPSELDALVLSPGGKPTSIQALVETAGKNPSIPDRVI